MFRGLVFEKHLPRQLSNSVQCPYTRKKENISVNQLSYQFVHSINIADRLESFQDDVVSEMRCKIQCIDDDMRRIVRSQTTVEDEATR
jgi:hypothetical protein